MAPINQKIYIFYTLECLCQANITLPVAIRYAFLFESVQKIADRLCPGLRRVSRFESDRLRSHTSFLTFDPRRRRSDALQDLCR